MIIVMKLYDMVINYECAREPTDPKAVVSPHNLRHHFTVM